MITKVNKTVYVTEDGAECTSPELAQKHALAVLMDADGPTGLCPDNFNPTSVSDFLVKYRECIVDILTTKATSRPKARKANGAVRKKRVAAEVQPEREP